MSTIGVGTTLDERWSKGQPECGEDACAGCGQCLGCPEPCPDDLSGYHMFVSGDGEVRLL